jgi:trans-aconitate 2-methyltransferase
MPWDPDEYLRFAQLRMRPAQDLLARIPLTAPQRGADLGCGTGEVTLHRAAHWPEAAVLGVDSSASMLGRARVAQKYGMWPESVLAEGEDAAAIDEYVSWAQAGSTDWEETKERVARVEWHETDIAEWEPAPGAAPDLIFSNAALHWLPDHQRLLPRLLGFLALGGCLAVQMPRSWGLPSHRLIRETLAEGGVGGVPLGSSALREQMARMPVGEAADYQALLAPRCRSLDIWETVYLQTLYGENPVLEWVQGSALRPVLRGLEPAERGRFLDVYGERLRMAYPARSDGGVPFPFQRLFIVATV